MQAITTKIIPASNTRPTRIKATSASGLSKTIAYPYDSGDRHAHRLAAETLAISMGWQGHLIQGGTKDGYCFVLADEQSTMIIPGTPIDAYARDQIESATHDLDAKIKLSGAGGESKWLNVSEEQARAIARILGY